MFSDRLVRPLLGAMALAGIGVHPAPRAPAVPDACALFTAAELSALVGKPITGGNRSTTGTNGGQCTYGYGMTQFDLELFAFPSPAAAKQKWASELKDYQSDPAFGIRATKLESGVGDAAFSATGTLARNKILWWSVVRGTRLLHVITMGPDVVTLDRLRAVALKGISR